MSRRQRVAWALLPGLLVSVDQMTKWLTGHGSGWTINPGVGRDLPRALDPIWAGSASGALADLVAAAVLVLAARIA